MSSSVVAIAPVREDSMMSPVRFDGSRLPHCTSDSIIIYLAAGRSVMLLPISESDSIASLKLRIQSFQGFVTSKQKLVFDGRELSRNNSLVRDYGVSDGNLVHLVMRLSNVCSFVVETTCGKKYEMQVERSRNIGYIKQELAKKGKDFRDVEDHKLSWEGVELDDQQAIADICENGDAVIHLLISRSAKVRPKYVDKDIELSITAPEVKRKEEVDEHQEVALQAPVRNHWIEAINVNPKVQLSPSVVKLVPSVAAGLTNGNLPVMSSEGSGGAYFMLDALGLDYVAVFKPIDEEPMAENNPRGLPLSLDGEGLKKGTLVGQGAFREVAAYILDHPAGGCRTSGEVGFAGVPPTTMVRCLSDGFHHSGGSRKKYKIGSLQMFVKNHGSCEDMGPRAFPVEEVHKISVLDMRLANADRHAGNILICKEEDGQITLVPIDHGYCLPENFEDCTFEWLYWPQAKQPFSYESIKYIRSLNAEEDVKLLKFYGWDMPLECTRTLRISTMLLKKGAERGLTPYGIGSIMCRETVKKESKIEEFIHEAKDTVLPGTSEAAFLEAVSDIMDRHLDEHFP